MEEQTLDRMPDSCHCPSEKSLAETSMSVKRRITPIAGGILIALLPKCPFCILAYSSAVTMCSGATVYDHQPGWFSYVSIALALLIIFSIARNFRSARSLLALLIALIGTGFIGYSELWTGDLSGYKTGAFLLLFAALLNGGIYVVLRSFARKMILKFS